MNIGIVVYSWSGNTLSVAESLKNMLEGAGHAVALEPVTVVGERKQGDRSFRLESVPDVAPYDAIVFGSAVEAFSLSPVLTAYLKQVGSLEGKTVACLVTQQFPYPWMGGNRAVRQMKKLCRSKGAKICGSGVVNWAKSRRERTKAQVLDRLSKAF